MRGFFGNVKWISHKDDRRGSWNSGQLMSICLNFVANLNW